VLSPTIRAPTIGNGGPGPERQLVSTLTLICTGSGQAVPVGKGVLVTGKIVLVMEGAGVVCDPGSTAVRNASKVLAAMRSMASAVCVVARSSGDASKPPQA